MTMSLKILHLVFIEIIISMAFFNCGRSSKVSLKAVDSLKAPLSVDLDISILNQKIEEFIMDTISEKFSRFVDIETRLQNIVNNPEKWLQDVIANASIEICSCPPGKHDPFVGTGQMGNNDLVVDKSSNGNGANQEDQGLVGNKGGKGDISMHDGKDGPLGEVGVSGELTEENKETTGKIDEEKKTFKWLLLFIQNYYREVDNLQIFITSSSNEDGNCNVTSPDRKLPNMIKIFSNSTSTYPVNKSMTLTTGYSKKGIVVECDVPVSVFGFNHARGSSDGFAVLPASMIGQEYIVPAYYPHSHSSLFGITTLTNETSVTVTVLTNTSTERKLLEFDNKFYGDNEQFTITLDALQTAQIECSKCDLSGTLISSSAPIAVVSGADCAKVYGRGCSHISEMIVPVSAYSDVFLVPLLPESCQGKVRIFALTKASVSIHSFDATNTQIIRSKDFVDISYNDKLLSFESTSPVMVQLYGNFYASGADAFMMSIPGIDQYKNRYTFTVPDFKFKSFLSFITSTEERDGIRLDGKPVVSFPEREVVLQNKSYTSFIVNVTSGFHMAEHVNKDGFGLFIVGFTRRYNGYGFTAGT